MRGKALLLAATVLLGLPALPRAQAGTAAPEQLPGVQGTVAEYSLTPRGDVDGLILSDGTEVHLPPHLGTQLVYAVKPGDQVTVHGLRARAEAVMQAMSVRNDKTGATVVDDGPAGPPGPGPASQVLSDTGRVKEQLHGPRGELNGVLMEDGTIVRLPPPEAQRLAPDLKPGATLTVRGKGYAGPLGRVIAATAIGPDADKLTRVEAPPLAMAGWHRPPPPPPPGSVPPPAPPAQ